jgi:RNA polymerase sigma factor (sigma-70 family)
MLTDCICHLRQPRPILDQFENIRCGEKLYAVLRRVAQRFEQPGRYENRHVMGLAAKHPCSLFNGEPCRGLPDQRQKLMLFFLHAIPVGSISKGERRLKTFYIANRAAIRFDTGAMDDLIKLVRTYRLAAGLTERLRLAEQIFRLIMPDLRVFVFSGLPPQLAEDALQEVLKAVATGMSRFEGGTTKEFWSWCYRIARNKLNDQYRRQSSERMVSMSPDELCQVVEASAQVAPLTPQNRLDLEYAMKLLTAAKPECSDLLWRHYVIGLDYAEIAEEKNLNSDTVRMRMKRCLDEAKSLVA